MDQSKDEDENPLNHENFMKQTNWKFIKYVIHHKHSMTPEQFKQKPFKQIIKIQHEKLDTEEGQSNKEDEKSTTSSEKSEQDSESDTFTEDEEESITTETHQIHNGLNSTMHDEDNSSDPENESSEEENEDEKLMMSTMS